MARGTERTGGIGRAAGTIAIAVGMAVILTWWLLLHAPMAAGTAEGPWRTYAEAGSAEAGLYGRARVAIAGLFALSRREAIYFNARETSDGLRLRSGCAYLVEVMPPHARWWSVTAYADDFFLIPNPAHRYSFNMANLPPGPDGRFRLIAAPDQRPGNWLPTGAGGGGFSLTLRLYNPEPDHGALPSIRLAEPCA